MVASLSGGGVALRVEAALSGSLDAVDCDADEEEAPEADDDDDEDDEEECSSLVSR